MSWYKSPQSISHINNADCLFAIDENGNSSLKNSDKFTDNNKLFTITGVHFDMNNFEEIRDGIMDLKNVYWEEGNFRHQRVVLHAKDIRKKQGAFNPKVINLVEFNNTINNFLSSIPIEIYSATIDKETHVNKYKNPYPVYELGVEFILERFCFDLRRQNKTGIILLESRGYKEDVLVLEKVKKLLNEGNKYAENRDFSVIKGVYFNTKRTKDGKRSHWPLEIVDLISYRIYSYIKSGQPDDNFNQITTKIYGYPNFNGKGLKLFP